MKNPQKSDIGLICLTLLVAIAITIIAGCVDSAQEQQS